MRVDQMDDTTAVQAIDTWRAAYPPRAAVLFRTSDPFGTTDAIYLGIYNDSTLCAVVTLQPRARRVYEVHLALKGGQDVGALLPALFSIKAELFGELGVGELVSWVPVRHAGIQRVTATLGFAPTGATLLQVAEGRLVESRQLSLKVN